MALTRSLFHDYPGASSPALRGELTSSSTTILTRDLGVERDSTRQGDCPSRADRRAGCELCHDPGGRAALWLAGQACKASWLPASFVASVAARPFAQRIAFTARKRRVASQTRHVRVAGRPLSREPNTILVAGLNLKQGHG